MGLFNQRKPRRFDHRYMFVDERKDKLKDVERRAKAELGMDVSDRPGRERLRGVFLSATRHASSRRERRLAGGFVLTYGAIIVLLVILVAVWKMLLSL
jgi:hypothetical protein